MKNINEKTKEEIKKAEEIWDKAKLGLLAAGTLGVMLYGFSRGHKIGYQRGVKDGVVYANKLLYDAVHNIAKTGEQIKGE